jgi:hypothetical protein
MDDTSSPSRAGAEARRLGIRVSILKRDDSGDRSHRSVFAQLRKRLRVCQPLADSGQIRS